MSDALGPPTPEAGYKAGLRAPSRWDSAHNHHRAMRVVHDLVADRARHELDEPPGTARSDDHQVRSARGLDQFLGRKAADRPHRHRSGPRLTELAGHLEGHFLSALAFLLQVFGILRENNWIAGPPALRDEVDGKDGKRSVADRCLIGGPFQRADGVVRSVDADCDTRHLLPPLTRLPLGQP